MRTSGIEYDPLLFGASADSGIVAIEHVKNSDGTDEMVIFTRKDGQLQQSRDKFTPFMIVNSSVISTLPESCEQITLAGNGEINTMLRFPNWETAIDARKEITKLTGFKPSSLDAPFVFVTDPVQHYLMQSGKTFFGDINFEDLQRMQVDIECFTADGYDFCNAARESDRIIAIAISDQSGWSSVLSGADMSEKELLENLVKIVQERDPDIIEGHNIFNFDLPYIASRAKRHKVKLTLGRDGSTPTKRPSRFNAGERTISYSRFEIYGRSIIDTLFMAQSYDISHRELDGYGLKDVAIHFGVAAKDRTYIDGNQISQIFTNDPEKLIDYARDDVIETEKISGLLSRSSYVQAQMLPFSYQNVSVRGNAVKIDALLIREYLRQKHSLPMPSASRSFSGGYTDMFAEGVIKNVHHCDVRSLYPSLMLTQNIAPESDLLGVFLKALETLRTFRIEAKQAMQACQSGSEKQGLDALQSTFKILINSFYGYLGFDRGRFNDFDAADKVTSEGRSLLRSMVDALREYDANPIEIDTDGIYFVPPDFQGSVKDVTEQMATFRKNFSATLPAGIEVEFDGEYASMYSYKMKNYALLGADGKMSIKGAALKSRGLESFQRKFMHKMLRLKLEDQETDLPDLRQSFDDSIAKKQWPIEEFAKKENLQNSPANYAAKRANGQGSRRAAYELALVSEREYKAGDQVSYYVTGIKKNVAVYASSKLTKDWDPNNRDENISYYQAKLEALYKKFGGPDRDSRQGELF